MAKCIKNFKKLAIIMHVMILIVYLCKDIETKKT